MSPFSVKKNTPEETTVPCGKCPACLARRVSGWSFRLMQEDKHAISSQFVTLTYDTKHVPITDSGFLSLRKRDVQLFIKRLRETQLRTGSELFKTTTIKYYAVGEYGGKGMRPHYHIILFNAQLELIEGAWNQQGAIHYGQVSGASVGYTLKYITKPHKVPMHRNDDRLREFSLMSKGLGKSYLSERRRKWHMDDMENRMYLSLPDGKKCAMPRYYKQKLYTDEQREHVGICTRMRMLKDIKGDGMDYPAYIIAQDKYQQAVKAAINRTHFQHNQTAFTL